MREFAKVSPRFWTGQTGKQIRALGRDVQVMAVYLLSAPSSNHIGLYYLSLPAVTYEIGISREDALVALEKLAEVGFASYDPVTEFVWVVNMARFQVGETLKPDDNRVKATIRLWREAAKTPFFKTFHARYAKAYWLPPIEKEEEVLGSPSEGALGSPLEGPSGRPFEGPLGRGVGTVSLETETETERERAGREGGPSGDPPGADPAPGPSRKAASREKEGARAAERPRKMTQARLDATAAITGPGGPLAPPARASGAPRVSGEALGTAGQAILGGDDGQGR